MTTSELKRAAMRRINARNRTFDQADIFANYWDWHNPTARKAAFYVVRSLGMRWVNFSDYRRD